MNLFKIIYQWYEDDHDETLIAKDVTREQFETDLKSAIEFAKSLLGIEIGLGEDYLGKGYAVSCLPEYYEQVIWFLINKLGYIEVEFNATISYEIDDSYDVTMKAIKVTNEIKKDDL